MQLQRELAEEKQKNLRLEFEAKTRHLERELKEKRLPTIRKSESVEFARTVQDRNLETYVSKFARPVQGRGMSDEPASGIQGTPRVLNPVPPGNVTSCSHVHSRYDGIKTHCDCWDVTNRWGNFIAIGQLPHTDTGFDY